MLSGKASRVTAKAPGVHDWVQTTTPGVWFCPTCGVTAKPDWAYMLYEQPPCTEIPARREIDGVIVEGPPS